MGGKNTQKIQKTQQTKELLKHLKEIEEISLLDLKEEKKLIRQIKKGNKKAKEKLFKANLKLVVAVAKKFFQEDRDKIEGLTLSELIQEGKEALFQAIEAVEKFTTTPEVVEKYGFTIYACFGIRRAIFEYLTSPQLKGAERKKAIIEAKIRAKQQSKELKEFLKKVNRIPELTFEEEEQLWERVKMGDKNAKKRICEGYLKLVVKIARGIMEMPMAKRYPYLTLLELIREGEKALWEEIDFSYWALRKKDVVSAIFGKMDSAISRKAGIPEVIEDTADMGK